MDSSGIQSKSLASPRCNSCMLWNSEDFFARTAAVGIARIIGDAPFVFNGSVDLRISVSGVSGFMPPAISKLVSDSTDSMTPVIPR